MVHGSISAAAALAAINTIGEELGAAAIHIGKLHQELKPRDAIEEMIIDQIAATYARVIRLSARSMIQRDQGWHRAMSEACDRAANTFRRLVLALRDYRDPRHPTVMAIQQATLANQQVVQQISEPKENPNGSSAIQAVTERPAIPSGNDQAESPLAAIDRSKDDGREDSLEHERAKARAAIGQRASQRTRRR